MTRRPPRLPAPSASSSPAPSPSAPAPDASSAPAPSPSAPAPDASSAPRSRDRRRGSSALGILAAWLALALGLAACAGGGKKERTTPDEARAGGDPQASRDPGAPIGGAGGADPAPRPDPAASGPGGSGGGDVAPPPAVTMPDYDPDPAQARAQVEQHLGVARAALAAPSPDADTALREARRALEIDAASVDAAAMVAFAYYHKKLYDTAELVLDDLFKRAAAKRSASVYYVYGLVYDHTRRPDRAVLSFQKAVELDPGHTSALVNVGVHQLQNTQYVEALQTFTRLVDQLGRSDAVTLTSLGSAYRGHAADYPATSPEHDDNLRRAEAAYKRALQVNGSYGPAYYNLGLLYLDNDPFPGLPDTVRRLDTSRSYFEQYRTTPGADLNRYDDRMKDVTRAIKRVEKQRKRAGGGSAPAPASAKGGGKR